VWVVVLVVKEHFYQLTRHCSLRSLVAKGTFSDADYFLRRSAKNNRHPLKVRLATSERSEQCRVSCLTCAPTQNRIEPIFLSLVRTNLCISLKVASNDKQSFIFAKKQSTVQNYTFVFIFHKSLIINQLIFF
jgi:hypothetical protein